MRRTMRWLMASPWRWPLASALFGAIVYPVGAWLDGKPVNVALQAGIALVVGVFGWFGWKAAYGSKDGGES